MRTMLDMVSDSINCDDPALFKSVAVKAYERKMLDIAELFAEKVLDINYNDRESLSIMSGIAIKKKEYSEALNYLEEYKRYYELDIKEMHDYFKCLEKCEKEIDDEDVELIKFLSEEDSLLAPERFLLLNYNKNKNDSLLWEVYFTAKENAGKTDDRKTYNNSCIYSDERWEIYLTFREDYSIKYHTWLSYVKVKSLLDNDERGVFVADNSDSDILIGKLKIRNVKDTIYKTENNSIVCLEQKIRVKNLEYEGREKYAVS